MEKRLIIAFFLFVSGLIVFLSTCSRSEKNEKEKRSLLPPHSLSLLHSASTYCTLSNHLPCLPPLVQMEPKWMVSKRLRLAICKIGGELNPFLSFSICYLNTPIGGKLRKKEIENFCNLSPSHFDVSGPSGFSQSDKWTFMAVVREPVTRFISAFVNKCVREYQMGVSSNCYGCGSDISCLLDRIYNSAFAFSQMKTLRNADPNSHLFYPQNWMCSFDTLPHNIIQYSSMTESSIQSIKGAVLGMIGRKTIVKNRTLSLLSHHLSASLPPLHSTDSLTLFDFYLNKLLTSTTLLRKFMQIYYSDFVVMGFPLSE